MKKRWAGLLWKTAFRIGGLLLAGLLLLYIFLYLKLPDHYYSTTWEEVQEKFETLREKIDGTTMDEAETQIDLLESKGRLHAGLIDENGVVIYSVVSVSEEDLMEENPNWWLIKGDKLEGKELVNTQFSGVRDLPEVVHYIQTVILDGKEYRLVMNWYTHSIHQVVQLLKEVFPVALVMIIISVLLFALIYAKIVTAPLIAMAQKAEIFSGKPGEEYPPDEIGTLQHGLDTLHEQVEEKVKELEMKNRNLEESMERVLELEKEQNDFFAAASHELKTPITATQMMLEDMIQEIGEYRDREKYLRECRKQMGRLSRLVEEILEVSRLNEGNEQAWEVISVEDMLHQLLRDYGPLAEKFAVVLELRCDNEVQVLTDPRMLYKALSNGMSNAIRHGEPGETVRVQLKGMLLDISNKGSIDENRAGEKAAVFAREADGRAGCGFGLYFIETIMKKLELSYRIYNGTDQRVHFVVNFTKRS